MQGKRLSIVVPYRDRADHLAIFVPHIAAYFTRDKCDCEIDYQVIIVEQEPALELNAGYLKNIGFQLGRSSSDYTCFHDIDYLPIWADYSYSEGLTPILWHGAERRPIAPGRTDKFAVHKLDSFFGGVVLVPNEQFTQVNGYSNRYWGWGYEDLDLVQRWKVAQLPILRRQGTFSPLDHKSAAFTEHGDRTATSLSNRRLYDEIWSHDPNVMADGLTTLNFEKILQRNVVPPPDCRAARWAHCVVKFSDNRRNAG